MQTQPVLSALLRPPYYSPLQCDLLFLESGQLDNSISKFRKILPFDCFVCPNLLMKNDSAHMLKCPLSLGGLEVFLAFPQFVPGETPKTPQTPYSKEFC